MSGSPVGDVELLRLVEELLVLGRTLEGRGRRLAALHGLRDRVEVAGAHFALVLDRREALPARREPPFLKPDEGGHVVPRIAVRQVEHRMVEAVEARERDELKLVTYRTECALEARDR